MLLLNNSQLTSLAFQRLIVSTYVHPPILADLQRHDLHQLRPRRNHPHSQRPAPARKSSAPSATSALVPMPSGSPWLTNSPPLCPAKPTSSTLPRPTASGRISSPKCSPLLHLRWRPAPPPRLPPTPTCWPFMSIKRMFTLSGHALPGAK